MPTTATFVSPTDGTALAIRTWGEELSAPRGVVQIAHGIAEHGQRYDRLARALVGAGYVVRAVDHRGHGVSVASADQLGHFDFEALVADVAVESGLANMRHRAEAHGGRCTVKAAKPKGTVVEWAVPLG
ncbi:alpha/beta hydrolase [Nocardioides albus]|uniref:Alpha-beta hydrolase superfamily lysophospholipase n=1 Tax=Nocardioides albus TaxID=1841 RepID=A0A7W5A5Q3_9ACTN|nr:alpha/beta hydrolase [Nocardioides albus]MBB3089885.1 alpha-beta hydrolase superfamily lysophospholipase [Nocardioides albus]GGU36336.1 hypothetical protein GCM10007979_39290 [Nocardioides albus]